MIKLFRSIILSATSVLILCLCSDSNMTYNNDLVFNTFQLNYYTENDEYIFSVNTDEPRYLDKVSKESGYLIKDCFYDINTSGYYVSSIFPTDNYVYFLKNLGMNNYEIIETNLSDFSTRTVYRNFENKLRENSFLSIAVPLKTENYTQISSFFVANGYLYLVMNDGIYCKFVNKNKKVEKIIDDSINCISYFDDNIYYVNDEMELIKYSIATKKSSILTDDKCMWVIACSTKLYYSNLNDKGYVYSIDFSGENEQIFLKEAVSEASIDNEYFYYSNLNDNRNLYRVKHDGTGNDVLCNAVCYMIDALDNRIFFLTDAEKTTDNEMFEYKCIDKSGNFIYED